MAFRKSDFVPALLIASHPVSTWIFKIMLTNLHTVFVLTQPTFTYSKLTIETLEEGMNMFKVNNKDTRTTPMVWFWYRYC